MFRLRFLSSKSQLSDAQWDMVSTEFVNWNHLMLWNSFPAYTGKFEFKDWNTIFYLLSYWQIVAEFKPSKLKSWKVSENHKYLL